MSSILNPIGSDAVVLLDPAQLKALVAQFPDLGVAINAIIDRLVDLLPVVRGAVYDA